MGTFRCTELLPSVSARWEHITSVTLSDNEYGELEGGWYWPSPQYDQKSLIRTELIEYLFTLGLNAYLFQIVSFPVLATFYYSSDLLSNSTMYNYNFQKILGKWRNISYHTEHLFIMWPLEILYHFKCGFLLEVFYWLEAIPCVNFSC